MSIKCSYCKKTVPEYGGIVLNIDGDFVCSEECKQLYEAKMNRFYKKILPDDDKFKEWLLGKDI